MQLVVSNSTTNLQFTVSNKKDKSVIWCQVTKPISRVSCQ